MSMTIDKNKAFQLCFTNSVQVKFVKRFEIESENIKTGHWCLNFL